MATLEKVLYVPELANNLFLEGTAFYKDLKYQADQNNCHFSQGNTIIAIGK